MIVDIFQLLSCLLLGILTGSLVFEGFILVPFWKNMEPVEFLKLHKEFGPKLFSYFVPLTILTTIIPISSAVLMTLLEKSLPFYSLMSALMVICMLMIYFFYFQRANESFKSGTVGVTGLPSELNKWASWHWLRVVLVIIAFTSSLLALQR